MKRVKSSPIVLWPPRFDSFKENSDDEAMRRSDQPFFLATEPFFESGYDGKSWIGRQQPDEQYFFEFEGLKNFTCADLGFELNRAFSFLLESHGRITLIDDQSLPSQLVRSLPASQHMGLFDLSRFRHWDTGFIETCVSKYGICDPKSIAFLQISRDLKTPVIWPRAYLRVFNVSYLRSLRQEFGKPYWTYVENERAHCIGRALSDLKILAVENILKISPRVFKCYFSALLPLWTLESAPFPHNDLQERMLLQGFLGRQIDLYGSLFLPEIKIPAVRRRYQSVSFPLAGMLRKYFGQHHDFNPLEEVYGSAH